MLAEFPFFKQVDMPVGKTELDSSVILTRAGYRIEHDASLIGIVEWFSYGYQDLTHLVSRGMPLDNPFYRDRELIQTFAELDSGPFGGFEKTGNDWGDTLNALDSIVHGMRRLLMPWSIDGEIDTSLSSSYYEDDCSYNFIVDGKALMVPCHYPFGVNRLDYNLPSAAETNTLDFQSTKDGSLLLYTKRFPRQSVTPVDQVKIAVNGSGAHLGWRQLYDAVDGGVPREVRNMSIALKR